MHYLSVLRDLVHKVLRSGETSSVSTRRCSD